jgi:extradiol dioxygenase family protein
VTDLDDALEFYVQELEADIGRRTPGVVDVLLFGAQLTLHEEPASVTAVMPRTRHFGATLPWDEWEALVRRLEGHARIVEPRTVSYEGETTEQGKLMLSDPSGNLIEVKAYRHPAHVLGPVALDSV